MFLTTKNKEIQTEFKQLDSLYIQDKQERPITLFIEDENIIKQYESFRSGKSNIKLQIKKELLEVGINRIPAETLIEEEHKNEETRNNDHISIFDNMIKINNSAFTDTEMKQFLIRYCINI